MEKENEITENIEFFVDFLIENLLKNSNKALMIEYNKVAGEYRSRAYLYRQPSKEKRKYYTIQKEGEEVDENPDLDIETFTGIIFSLLGRNKEISLAYGNKNNF